MPDHELEQSLKPVYRLERLLKTEAIMRRSVYVETLIHAPLPVVWARTQDPRQHQRWDARFTRIDYRPSAGPSTQFTYRTRVLPGLTVHGVGIYSTARGGGRATSALRFASAHPLSLIDTGSGYWRYTVSPDGVRFITGYSYRPAWGRFGAVADRAFRPVIGWATAWSFDRLRLWVETGVSPERLRAYAIGHAATRILTAVACVAYACLRANVATGLTAVAVTVAMALAPVPSGVPAARRCRRRPLRPPHQISEVTR